MNCFFESECWSIPDHYNDTK